MTAMGSDTAGSVIAHERVRSATGFAVLGTVGIIGGGLVSAATGPLSWQHGSWAAAYLVLVVGVAQLVFGVGQAWLAHELPGRPTIVWELVGWNLGSALVIVGAVLERPVVVDVGGALLVVALVLFARVVRVGRPGDGAGSPWIHWVYLLLVLVILVSIPIGLVLAALGGA